jgi:predicted secreted protein
MMFPVSQLGSIAPRVLRRTLVTFSAIVSLGVPLGCGGGGGSSTVRVADPRGTVHARVGDTLVLTFAAQPGVGYGWTLLGSAPAELKLQSDDFKADKPGLIGGPGSEVFTFKAQKTGTVGLVFQHAYRGRQIGNRRVVVVLS